MDNPSQRTTPAQEVIQSQIDIHDAELNRLDREIAALQARRDAVRLMRDALMPLLRPATEVTPIPNIVVAGTRAEDDHSSYQRAPTGFREAVRDVIRASSNGLSPADVLAEMRRRGTDSVYKGNVPIETRLHNELWKMRKSGHLGRRAGKYYLVQRDQETGLFQ